MNSIDDVNKELTTAKTKLEETEGKINDLNWDQDAAETKKNECKDVSPQAAYRRLRASINL